jgi:hypothetical protein
MPPSLRKACHACANAKRRCVPQLPQCSRCRDRGLVCTYDLEPVTNHATVPDVADHPAAPVHPLARDLESPAFFDSVLAAHRAVVESYSPHGNKTLPVMANPETLVLVAERFLRPIPHLTFQRQTTPYVHAQVLKAGDLLRLDMSTEPAALDELLGKLASLDIHKLDFPPFLAAFHALVAVFLVLTLDPSRGQAVPPGLLEIWPV